MQSYGNDYINAVRLIFIIGLLASPTALAQSNPPRGYDENAAGPANAPVREASQQVNSVPQMRTRVDVNPDAAGNFNEAPVSTGGRRNGAASSDSDATDTNSASGDTTPSFNRPNPNTGKVEATRFRTVTGTVKVAELFLNAYKDSVVRITARDDAGNKLSEGMGVAVGATNEGVSMGRGYIATVLSLALGNDVQWADRIEVTQDSGATYPAEVALIDEQLNLVLLKPKVKPTAIRFVAPDQERGKIDVLTISFDRDRRNEIVPNVHKAVLAALDPEEGTLVVSGKTLTDAQAGTAIINMSGELMGMLLPGNNGVLSSAIQKAIQRIQDTPSISPRLIGSIMGRGVLVDPNIPGAYPTIEKALTDIKQGVAPKADPKRYNRASTNEFKPKASPRIVVKVAPGVYRPSSTLELANNISPTGSGTDKTVIVGTMAQSPVISVSNAKNVSIANLRVTPPASQAATVATVALDRADGTNLLGNLIEAKGGRAAVHLLASQRISILGNAFPQGKEKAIYCQTSGVSVEANSFLGKWPQAIAVGKGCVARVSANLFVDNEISVATSAEGRKLDLSGNTFLRSVIGARFYGALSDLNVEDNLFYANRYSLVTTKEFSPAQVGRNAAWNSVAFREGQAMTGLDFVKGKTEFRNAEAYDYRLLPGSPGANSGIPRADGSLTDIGAFQAKTFVGEYTPQFLHSLETATGEKDLAEAWGFKLRSQNDSDAPASSANGAGANARRPSSESGTAPKKPSGFLPGGA